MAIHEKYLGRKSMDNLTQEQRHKTMSRIHGSNTKPEIILRKALWHKGIRYRKNYAKLPGKPDIAITRCKIAVFVDGDFWHARDMNNLNESIRTHRDYWIPKLRRNKDRDAEVNDMLTEQGWLVLRFWESDIEQNLNRCIKHICGFIPYYHNL